MRQPDPKATEFQQFGLIGIVMAAAAALGIAYGLLKVVGWI